MDTPAIPKLPAHLSPFCEGFLCLLERWNRRHALTSLEAPVRKEELLLDSAILLPWLDPLAPGSTVADFGTGMGIPALLLAAARPELQILAVDRSAKKLAFVRQAVLELGLPNLQVRQGDAAALPTFGAALGVAKAVGGLPLLLAWWERHGLPGAPFLALKGAAWRREECPEGWSLEAHPYQLPTRGGRVLLEARKRGALGRP